MRKHLGQLVLLIMLLFYAGRCWAQTAAPEGAFESQHELVVGTKEAPPFSMKTADGT